MGGFFGKSEETIRASLRDRPLVVICGGGYAGTAIAPLLDEDFNVLLIDRKNYFFHNIGALRASTQPDTLKNVLIPYTKILKFGSVIQAEIEQVTAEGVRVHGREELIPFDYCVITTGTSYSFPAKVGSPMSSELPPLYQDIEAAIRESQKPLIIGGGPVGMELLGEIMTIYPDKNLTLVHSRDNVWTEEMPDNFRNELKTRIGRSHPNAKLILGARVVLDDELTEASRLRYFRGERTVNLSNGESIEVDLIMFCNGSRVNCKSYEETFEMNERNQIVVNEFHQVVGQEKIFAFGDCCATAPNFGWVAKESSAIVAKNIKALSQGRPEAMVPSQPMQTIALVPLGTKDGASILPGVGVVGNWMTHFLKGSDMLAAMTWKQMKFPNGVPAQMMDMAPTGDEEDAKEEPAAVDETVMEKISRFGGLPALSEEQVQELMNGLPVPPPDDEATHT